MELSTPVIIGIVVLAIILVIVLIAVGVKASKRRKAQQQEEDRRRAAQLREEAANQEQAVQERDLKVRETELEADRSRLEAQRKAKEAEQEQLAAERRRAEVERERAEVDQERSTVQERLAEADRLDPDTAADDSRRGRDRSAVAGDATREHHDGREHHEHREHLVDTAHREDATDHTGRGRTGAHDGVDADHGRTARDADGSAPQRHDGQVHQGGHGVDAAAAGAAGAGAGVAGAGITGAADHGDRTAADDTDARGAGHGRRAARPGDQEPLIGDAPERTPAAASTTETRAADENRSDTRTGTSTGTGTAMGSGAGVRDDRQPGSDGSFGHPVSEDRLEQHSDVSRAEHPGQPARVEHSYEQQTPPAEQQFGHPGTPGAQQTPPADHQFDQHDQQGQQGQQFDQQGQQFDQRHQGDQHHQGDQPFSQHDQLGAQQGVRQDHVSGPDSRVQDGSVPQEAPARQQREDEQDPFFQQPQLLNEQNGELPPRAPEYGDPLDRPLQDGAAEDGTHRG